jgi:hypothetical protein
MLQAASSRDRVLMRWIFQFTESFQPHYGPGLDSASNRNEYQESSWGVKGGRGVGLTTLPLSVSQLSRKMWEPRHPTTLWAFTACYRDSFSFYGIKRGRIAQTVWRLATGWTAEEVGGRILVGAGFFSPPNRPDRIWGPPSRLFNQHRRLFPRVYSGQGVKLTTHRD